MAAQFGSHWICVLTTQYEACIIDLSFLIPQLWLPGINLARVIGPRCSARPIYGG